MNEHKAMAGLYRQLDDEATPANAVRSSGLPILSTERLSGAEKKALLLSAEAHRRIAALLDNTLYVGRVDLALAAMQAVEEVSIADRRLAQMLGSNR